MDARPQCLAASPPPVSDITLGDVNLDGVISVLDIISVANTILGIEPTLTGTGLLAADLDQNGVVNVTDIIGIVNIILGL